MPCCVAYCDLFQTLVDEVDEMLGVGPEIFEDLEDFVKTGKQPFDHVYETLFLCMSCSTILLLQRNHDEVVTTLVVAFVTFLLKLASSMTLPSYEGYKGGSR